MFLINIDFQKCKACGYCIQVCPNKVLAAGSELNEKGYAVTIPERLDKCVGCSMCATVCPEAAIEILKSKTTPQERNAR